MKDQPWHLNQTGLVGRKWCRFTNIHKNFGGRPPKMGRKSIKCLDHFSVTSAVDTHICGMKRRMKKNKNANANLQCVPYKVTYFA